MLKHFLFWIYIMEYFLSFNSRDGYRMKTFNLKLLPLRLHLLAYVELICLRSTQPELKFTAKNGFVSEINLEILLGPLIKSQLGTFGSFISQQKK